MKIYSVLLILLFIINFASAKDCKKSNSKLLCYYSNTTIDHNIDACKCTHVILPTNYVAKSIDKIKDELKGVKFLITINEFNQDLVTLLKLNRIDGVEIDLNKQLESKEDISDFVATIKSKFGNNLQIALSVPAKTEILAKFYDFKTLTKNVDLFILQTAFLGVSKNVTFHPSRLSGLWDMQNIDSVVDLVSGLGVPLGKLVITSPVQAFKFKLQDKKYTAPGSPALEIESITRNDLCETMKTANWTLERDQDQTGPYIFSGDQWIAFDDEMSIDIKAKYTRVRGLAGMALKDLTQDGGKKCDSPILDAAFTGLNRQARAPRAAVLQSLERGIMADSPRLVDTVQTSTYRISRIIDVEGNVHVIRQDTRTEFQCSRQGYFVHPRSCNRFYRCVKFDQLSDEFSVFEFDCPAGLAFDERVEVCVWPGSLPDGAACSGSSEIAPVPRQRFICPQEPGYYADPENCRWFFACMDHGKSPLSAYEFRCPFGLVYDESRLLCEWPWLVPRCASGYTTSTHIFGGPNIDHYNGLGVLSRIPLGGIIGPIPKPQIYTNIGSGGAFINGLTHKSVQSLQNAGLLQVDSRRNQFESGRIQFESGRSQFESGGQFESGRNQFESGRSQFESGRSQFESGRTQFESGRSQFESGGQFASGRGQFESGRAQIESGRTQIDSGQNLVLNGFNENGQTFTQTHQGGVYSAGGVRLDENTAYEINSGLNDISKTFQYEQRTNQEQSNGIAGNINIIGAGYSSVGGIEVVNNGEQSNIVTNVTPSPISIESVSSIPSVTSVPLPNLKTAHAFESYGGGVVANVPQLQYRVTSPRPFEFSGIQKQDQAFSYQNIEAKSQSEGYNYPRPDFQEVNLKSAQPIQAILYNQPKSIYTYQNVVQNLQNLKGYSNAYEIPASVAKIGLVQPAQPVVEPQFVKTTAYTTGYNYQNNQQYGLKNAYNVVATPQPGVVVSTTPSTVTGYEYPRPSVTFKEQPQPKVIVSSTPKPIYVQGYNYPKPAVQLIDQPQPKVVVSSTPRPAVHYVEQPQPQVVVSSTPRPVELQGYSYPKPAVQFIEQPQPKVVVSSTPRPAVQFIEQPQLQVVVSSTPRPVELHGYSYPKPSVQFIEQPVQPVVTNYKFVSTTAKPVQPIHPVIVQEQPKAVVSSYSYSTTNNQANAKESGGYLYSKPAVQLIERPQPVQPLIQVQQLQPFILEQQKPITSSYSYSNSAHSNNEYKEAAVQLVKQPASFLVSTPKPVQTVEIQQSLVIDQPQPVVSTYNYNTAQKSDSTQERINKFQGYDYPKPQVQLVEQPQPTIVVSSTPKPTVEFQGYDYPKPAVQFIEQPKPVQPAVVTGYNFVSSTPTPIQTIQVQQPVIVQQPKPVVSTYSYSTAQRSNQLASNGLTKTAVQYIEQPIQPAVVTSYDFVSTTPKPVETIQVQQPVLVQQYVQQPVQPVITSYNYANYSANAKASAAQYQSYNYVQKPKTVEFYGYNYPKPEVQLVEEPKPAVVTSYNFVATTPRPIQPVLVQQPVVLDQPGPFVSSYSYNTATQHSSQFGSKDFKNLSVQFVDQPKLLQPVQPVQPVEASYSYTTDFKQNVGGYHYPKPSVQFIEQPKPSPSPVVTSYTFQSTPKPVQPVPVQKSIAIELPQPVLVEQPSIVEQPKPFVSSYNYNTAEQRTSQYENKEFRSSTIQFIDQPTYTPKPVQPVLVQQPAVVSSYDSRLTPKKVSKFEGYDYPKPAVQFVEERQPVEEVPFVQKKAYITGQNYQYEDRKLQYYPETKLIYAQQPIVVENYEAPLYSKSVDVSNSYYRYGSTTPKPTFQATVASVVAAKIQPTTEPFYYDSRLPSIQSVTPIQVVTTSRPIVRYEFGTNVGKATLPSTPNVEYLPVTTVRPKPVVVTTPRIPVVPVRTKAYVPPTKAYLPPVTPTKAYLPPATPTRAYLPPTTRRPITRVTTEYLPPPTPTREYLPVKKVKVLKAVRPKTIVKTNDFQAFLPAKLGAQCTCVSNTVSLKRKEQNLRILEIEQDDDDEYVVNDNNNNGVVVENYQYEPQKIEYTTRISTTTTSEPSDKEIVKAVRTGLKLVKQAAKEGAQEGTREVLSGKFDRYGPGGVRSRDERLQGTVDCQRPGLFRHPSQCNKFYSCRWDCTKNRYTLHVFNCPVHLTFDNSLGACNWPSRGPACTDNTLLPSD